MTDAAQQLDEALGSILAQGWSDPATPSAEDAPAPGGALEPAPVYPPLPQRDDGVHTYLEPQVHGGALKRSEFVGTPPDDDAPRGMMDIGLLTDLATGKKGAVAAAQAAGVTPQQLQSSLAIALREVPPEEIAKALGLQAAEQQLKSGALYGAVLADLVGDMALGRLKPEVKVELAKLLARIGRVEPKEAKDASTSSFVLNISMGAAAQPVTIEAG